ncbi:hypothetical protein BAY1663_02393 [Pseudomonas sp. BAY1663]|uniref:hypothetical protein n=1 Tax=Pseudomonas sp. BAY1663 TaxID=1439940 RepID=UPI00042DE094|nr:hypothetical protein [Pseudomonas sp. BAY1663]EXF45181.1 hypothetical protein BAY1663_02393 [Pseudomonas sp. BAY1663]
MHKPFALLCGLLFSGIGHAAELAVVQYVSDPVALLDETGRLLHKQPRAELPPPPLAALQWNEELELVQVEIGGQRVWLDGVDVRLNEGKTVPMPCARLPRGKAESATNLSTIGYGAGCEKP